MDVILKSKLFLSTIILILLTPSFLQITGVATDPTFIENRRPRNFPDIQDLKVSPTEYGDKVKLYIGDNYGLKVELLKLNYLSRYLIGVSANPGNIVGKNGWIFMKRDWDVFNQYRGINRFTSAELDAWIDGMEFYQNWLKERGIRFYVFVAPNQETIYPEYMPHYATKINPESRMDQILRRLRERQSSLILIDPRHAISQAKIKYSPYLLYHKLEPHWNSLGAFVGYSALMDMISIDFPGVKKLEISDFDIQTSEVSWTIPPLSEIEPKLVLKNKSKVALTFSLKKDNTSGKIEKTITTIKDRPSLLIYGDSFADTWLKSYLAENFTYMIGVETNWSTFPYELIDRENPNIVIYELVERYLPKRLERK